MTYTNPRLRSLTAVVLAIVLLLAACGSDAAEDASTAPVTETQSPTAAPATADDDTVDEAEAEAEPTDTTDAADEPAADDDSDDTDDETESPAVAANVETSLVPPDAAGADTTAGVEAAQWGDNVTITIADGTWRFESNGIPSHELPDQFLVPQTGSFTPPVTEDEVSPVDTDIAVVESPVDQSMTLTPVYLDETTDTNLGIIGVTISGAQLFNDYEDQDRAFVAVDDNFSVDGIFFVDSCNGHPLALLADGTGAGNYHYHGVPYCLTDVIDVEGEHSSVLGFLVDGFPFYGPQDANGATITSDELDECSGHFGATPEFPDGIYHYHLTEDRSPYTVDCYHGEVDSSASTAGQGGAPEGGGAPDFSDAAAALGVTTADLEAALGQPPFDLTAAAAALGVTEADLEAALPAPPS